MFVVPKCNIYIDPNTVTTKSATHPANHPRNRATTSSIGPATDLPPTCQPANDFRYCVMDFFISYETLLILITTHFVKSFMCYKCKKEGHLPKDCVKRADEAGQERTNGRRGDDDTLNDADKIAMEEYDIKEISEDEKVN
nr:nuclear export mediator factor NEMF [Tanacetum cinerariifolium]